MKWILAILLFISASAIGQSDVESKYIRYQNQYGMRLPRFWADSVLRAAGLVKFTGIAASSDTTTNKPIAIDGSGNVVKFGSWPVPALDTGFIRNQFTSAQDAKFWIDSTGRMRYLQVDSFATFAPIAAPTYTEGRYFYDNNNKTFTVMDDISGTSIQLAYENLVRARNNTGSTINDGQVVYISGALGQNPTIALAQANSIATSQVIGLATHNISNNTVGKVTTFGLVNDINTSAFNDGDRLYLSQTTPGALTNVEPTNGISSFVGVCLLSHVTQGKIFVHAQDVITTLQKVLNNNSTLTENENIVLADSLEFTSGLVVIDSLRLRVLSATTDTTTYKPMAVGTNGRPVKFSHWPGVTASQNIVDTVNKYLPLGTIYTDTLYYGNGSDSTWRTAIISGDFYYQRKESGTYITKAIISIEDDIIVLDSVLFAGSTFDAFGDSYTAGVGASPAGNAYIPLLETALSMTANNVGESGTGIMDVQFKMYRDFASFGQANRDPTTLLIGFNDYLKSSSGAATQAMFPYAFRAAIFNHFLDTAIASNDGNLTTTGSWSTFDLSASYPQKSKYLLAGTGRLSVASAIGDSKTYAFEGENVGFFFLGANGTTQDYGRLKVEIDGVSVDTVDENGIADNQTVFANSASRTEDLVGAAVVYTGLTNGSHTIKLTLLDNKNTNLDAFGVMEIPTASQSMVVGSIQKLLSAGYTAMSAGSPKNDAGVDATNAIIQAVVNEFRLLGYPVVFNDVNAYTNPSTDIDTDNIHWDNSGHAAGKNSFRAKIRL